VPRWRRSLARERGTAPYVLQLIIGGADMAQEKRLVQTGATTGNAPRGTQEEKRAHRLVKRGF